MATLTRPRIHEVELRWLLADKFEYGAFGRGKGADGRYRRYKNERRNTQ